MHQINICMFFLIFQPIIGCPNFAQNVHAVLKKSVPYKKCPLEAFLWEPDRHSSGSLKKCPLLLGVRFIASPLETGLAVL